MPFMRTSGAIGYNLRMSGRRQPPALELYQLIPNSPDFLSVDNMAARALRLVKCSEWRPQVHEGIAIHFYPFNQTTPFTSPALELA